MINVAILGYGTVGAGVYKVLHMNREKIEVNFLPKVPGSARHGV